MSGMMTGPGTGSAYLVPTIEATKAVLKRVTLKLKDADAGLSLEQWIKLREDQDFLLDHLQDQVNDRDGVAAGPAWRP